MPIPKRGCKIVLNLGNLNLKDMKSVSSLLALIVCLNLNAQKDKKVTSNWFEGSPGTLSPAVSNYVSARKGAVLYCIFNDDKNIYFESKITESIDQNKILQMGLTLWVNTDGKSHKINGIKFPVGAKFSREFIRQNAGQQNNPLVRVTPLSVANTIQLVGFRDVEEKRFPSDNTDNIRGSVKYDNDGNLLYSLIIPRSKLPAAVKSKDGKDVPITFAMEYGAMPAEGGRPGGQMGDAPSSGGGGRSGGGGSGGRSGGGRSGGGGSIGGGDRTAASQNPNASESVIIWIKDIALVEKK